MKIFWNKIFLTLILFLAFFITSLTFSVTPVRANTLTTATIQILDGGSNPASNLGNFACEPYADGFKCHFLQANAYDFRAYQVTFSDSRGSGSKQYYAHFESRTEGIYGDDSLWVFGSDFWNSPIRYTFSPWDGQAFRGEGYNVFDQNFQSEERITTFTVQPFTSPYSMEVTFYLSPSPNFMNITTIPTYVYLDTSESAQSATWIARLQSYFDEINGFLARSGTNKRLYWNGTVTTGRTDEPFNFGNNNCHYDSETALKIWFTPTLTDPVKGLSRGTDCSSYGTIIIDTSELSGSVVPNYSSLIDGNYSQDWVNYWNVVIELLHEFIHTRGANYVEPYWFSDVSDNTVAPIVNIHISDDDFWWNGFQYGGYNGNYTHPGFLKDPIRGRPFPIATTMYGMRSFMALSSLSQNFINSNSYVGQIHTGTSPYTYGPYDDKMFPNFTNLRVTQYNGAESGNPVQGIRVRAWYLGVNSFPAESPVEITNGVPDAGFYTDANGQVNIPWSQNPYDPIYNTIILKSYDAQGNQYGRTQFVDVYNLQQKVFATGGPITEYSVNMGAVNAPEYTYTAEIPGMMAIEGQPATSGWIRESAKGSGVGGAMLGNGQLFAGDDSLNRGIRTIVQFDTSSVPDDAIITSAQLGTWNNGQNAGSTLAFGPSSYPSSITVQIGNPCIGNCYLELSDYQASLTTLGYMEVGWVSWPPSPYTFIFTNYLTRIAKTGVTDFRLRFNRVTDNDNAADKTGFWATSSSEYHPFLNVTYHMP